MPTNSEFFNSSVGPTTDEKVDWRDEALCAETDPNFFVLNKGESANVAKKICAACDVGRVCLQYALDKNEQGVWGGTSYTQREKLAGLSSEQIDREFLAIRAKNQRLK